MTDMTNLREVARLTPLPCPFCGCTTIRVEDYGSGPVHVCDWCEAEGPQRDADEAIGEPPLHWNTRAVLSGDPATWAALLAEADPEAMRRAGWVRADDVAALAGALLGKSFHALRPGIGAADAAMRAEGHPEPGSMPSKTVHAFLRALAAPTGEQANE